ncbi:hypothetical protein KKH43_06710 [Patescibacteria group bacterium]|nr:hypothetical protein [Patescibacteria group bacterium]
MAKKNKHKKKNYHLEHVYRDVKKDDSGSEETEVKSTKQSPISPVSEQQTQGSIQGKSVRKDALFALSLTVLCVGILGVLYYFESTSPFIDATANSFLDSLMSR